MNYSSLALAALGGTVASFAFGFLLFWLVPGLIKEAHKYPAVFRPKEEMTAVMPVGLVATFLSILVAAIIFAMIHHGGSGAIAGARFGVLLGLFVVCAFVLHNYVNLQHRSETDHYPMAVCSLLSSSGRSSASSSVLFTNPSLHLNPEWFCCMFCV